MHFVYVSFVTQITVIIIIHSKILLARNSLLNNTIPQLQRIDETDYQDLQALMQIL